MSRFSRSKSQKSEPETDTWRAPVITPRLIIREAIGLDVPKITATIDDEVRRESGMSDVSVDLFAQAVEHGYRVSATRVICEKPAARVIGGTFLLDDDDHDVPVLWLWLGAESRDRGFELEALTALVDHLHRCGTPRVQVHARHDAAGDIEVVERAGFARTHDDTLVSSDGQTINFAVYEHAQPTS